MEETRTTTSVCVFASSSPQTQIFNPVFMLPQKQFMLLNLNYRFSLEPKVINYILVPLRANRGKVSRVHGEHIEDFWVDFPQFQFK
jgi:hypothetical protein